MIGATASSDAAESFAQNKPSGLEYEAMNTVSGAAFALVRLMLQKASFHESTMSRREVEEMPGSANGVKYVPQLTESSRAIHAGSLQNRTRYFAEVDRKSV